MKKFGILAVFGVLFLAIFVVGCGSTIEGPEQIFTETDLTEFECPWPCGDCTPTALEDMPMCTLEYIYVMGCQVYESCEKVENGCMFLKDPRYDICVSCIEECEATTDTLGMDECSLTCY